MLRRIARAVKPYPKAAMFELAEQGFDTPFQQLVGCILSIRTRDEVSLPASLALLGRAGTAEKIGKLTEAQIDKLIGIVAFHRPKAKQIRTIARLVVKEWKGELPCEFARGSRDESLGLCADDVAGKNPRGFAIPVTQTPLDPAERAARALWQAHLHRPPAEMLDVSGTRVLSAGRRHVAPLK